MYRTEYETFRAQKTTCFGKSLIKIEYKQLETIPCSEKCILCDKYISGTICSLAEFALMKGRAACRNICLYFRRIYHLFPGF